MSRRIDIELTSARPDGTWTWRAAGAREPRGVLDGTLLPAGAGTGAVLKADAEFGLDGTTILSVSTTKEKSGKTNLLEILPTDKPFEEVTSQLTGRADRGDRRDRRDRPPRRSDGDGPSRGPRHDRGPRPDGAPGPDGGPRPTGDAPRRDRPTGDGPRRDRPAGATDRGPRSDRSGSRPERGPRSDQTDRPARRGPRFAAPPELPQRPKAKRLKPGRAHRSAVLAGLPEEQHAVAERALQGGIPAVRQAVNEQNARLKAEGKPEIPAAGLLSMAEELLPRLRVAEWLDRADAALHDLEELDLRDLRSVVAAADDPTVARDESTRQIAAQLKEALIAKQDKELALWFADIEAAIGVGRIVRALKLSSQPPKAGVRFPAELAGKLAATTTSALSVDALPDRWVAVLEAAAFSPIRSHVQPTDKPAQVNDELLATIRRIGSLLPHIAALFGVEVVAGAQSPKPLRPTRPTAQKKPAANAPIPPPPMRAPVAASADRPEPTSGQDQPAQQAPFEAEPAVNGSTDDGSADGGSTGSGSTDTTDAATTDPDATVHVPVIVTTDDGPVDEGAAEQTDTTDPDATDPVVITDADDETAERSETTVTDATTDGSVEQTETTEPDATDPDATVHVPVIVTTDADDGAVEETDPEATDPAATVHVPVVVSLDADETALAQFDAPAADPIDVDASPADAPGDDVTAAVDANVSTTDMFTDHATLPVDAADDGNDAAPDVDVDVEAVPAEAESAGDTAESTGDLVDLDAFSPDD
jgi:hypothetical protein